MLRELKIVKGGGWFAWGHVMPNLNLRKEAGVERGKVAPKEKRCTVNPASCFVSRCCLPGFL